MSGGFKLISCTAAGDKFLFPRLNVPARIEITVCFPRLKSQRAVREVGNQAQNVQATCLSCTKRVTCYAAKDRFKNHKSFKKLQDTEEHCSKLAMQTEWHRMSL